MHSQHKGPTMPAQPERPPLGDKFDPARYARAYVNSGEPLSEDRVLDSILRALRAVRSLAWHIDAGGKKTRASLFRAGISLRAGGLGDAPEGFPDVVGVAPDGLALLVEVKRPGVWTPDGRKIQEAGKPSAAQKAFIAEAKLHGARAGFAWSVEDALEIAGVMVRGF